MIEKAREITNFIKKIPSRLPRLPQNVKIITALFSAFFLTQLIGNTFFFPNTPRFNPQFLANVSKRVTQFLASPFGQNPEIQSQVKLENIPSSVKTGAIILPWYYCPPDGRTCIPDRWKYKPPGSETPYTGDSYYRPDDLNFWKIQAHDMTCSGLDIAFIYIWESQQQYFDNVQKMIFMIKELETSPLKIAEYWDASFASNDGGPTDLGSAETARYRYEKFIKPFYQTVPKDLWATENGRPLLTVYRYGRDLPGSDLYTNPESANVFFQNIKNLFKQDFGVEPFLNLGSEWFKTNAGDVADGKHEVFNASVACDGNARSHTVNGYTTTSVSPGGWDYRDFGCHLQRNDDGEFKKGLSQVPQNANLILIESWNELGEGSGMERAVNYPSNSGGTLSETFYIESLRNILGKTDRPTCKSIPQILELTGAPTVTPNPNEPTTPPGQPTNTPVLTQPQQPTTPPGQPTTPQNQTPGSVKIIVHKDSLDGPVWDLQTNVAVYIEGPSSGNHRFGELLQVSGTAKSSCTSRGGFPYGCPSAGAVVWQGADGKSGTAPGSYTASVFTVPAGWNIIAKQANGTLVTNSSLTLDLVISNKNLPTLPPNQPTPTIGGGGNLTCPTTSSQTYTSLSVGVNNHNKLRPPFDSHPEVNLRLRGFGEVNESTQLQGRNGNWDGLDDKMPPQYSSLFNGPVPEIAKTYVVYEWDFQNNRSLAPNVASPNYKVHMIGFAANQGQSLYGLKAGRTIDGSNVFLVLHATANDILFTHSNGDNLDDGYLFYFLDLCVDPKLLAKYNSDASGGRRQLPVIAPGQIFGYAGNTDPKSSVRDTMSFVDPRAKEDWWFYPR